MIRLAVFSRSDAFHRELAAAARRQPDLSIELRIRSVSELRGGGVLDAIVVDTDDRVELERIADRVPSVPIVHVGADSIGPDSGAASPRWSDPNDRFEPNDRRDGSAEITGRDPDRILAAARAVAHGLIVLEPDDPERDAPIASGSGPADLTPREYEVLVRLARGRTNAAVADELGISANTVKYHLSGIFAKLDVGTRSEAIWQAARRGIISM